MNKFILDNGKELYTDLKLNTIYESSRAVISYPYTFTNKIRKISQEFIVGSEHVPIFNPSLRHPRYNSAYIINQSEANIDPSGFCRFKREYIEFASDEVAFPKTLSYTFPTLWIAFNYEKRGVDQIPLIEEGIQLIDSEGNPIFIPAPKAPALRRNPITMNIPVEERIQIIFIGDGIEDTETIPNDIPIGSAIIYQSYTWLLNSNDDGVSLLTREGEDGETISLTTNLNQINYSYINSNADFTKISPTLKYTIKDTYESIGSGYLIDNNRNPHSSEVDFVDISTIPNTETYLSLANNKNSVCLQTSTFEHLGGFVYMKKTLFGNLR